MSWIGPYTIEKLLDSFSTPPHYIPPESNGVYLVSKEPWVTCPTKECIPLYVGSNTGRSKCFRTRIGLLIGTMFGFFNYETCMHCGGKKICEYCNENNINPKELFIGWYENSSCNRCDENRFYDELNPCLNRRQPNRCRDHPRSVRS